MRLIHRRYQRQRLSAWLGMFAILMLFIAPVISTSLENARGPDLSTLIMDTGTESMPVAHTHGDITHSSVKSSVNHAGNLPMMNHAACDYCQLLVHLPLLNTAENADVRITTRLAVVVAVLFFSSPIMAKDIYSELQPRAPPAFYF